MLGSRPPLSKSLQVAVYRRDGWLCCWCKRPVIFAPVMKYLEREVRKTDTGTPLAYHHANWSRQGAPLLDLLGAVIDHIEAFSTGGASDIENLATACNKCNGRKGSATLDNWGERVMDKPIKGKYGEPQRWDGLSTMFVILAQRDPDGLSKSEKDWLKALGPDAPPVPEFAT
jgi:5-methylcytosine-specific restriction endonuclease McrA